MKRLTRLEIRALIDKLVIKAEALEMEAVAKTKARHHQRQAEGIAARKAAKICRSNIQELTALLHQ
jgi:ribosomal protein L19E